ncbi:toll/interleukin-1 receptor domain-containing protein [Novosphingobium clariflavum]|uniref:Toll/interleukin-1 receptor domain-containing protein n=1 Tax=Novosphingobium clariflavum TaxID=2029884 RepID=A0ABV6S3V9_9SPHN|nr:toll/interleukin-1 receptor domain-containing protein [Novosphingobium clariflavum]
MKAFISHNKADKFTARTLATMLTEQGEGVWFDEWDIKPGDSLTGGIEEGLNGADVFVLIWSEHAHKSNWVGMELRATVRRRVDDQSLRIIPLIMDGTPLPTLVADFRGFDLSGGEMELDDVVNEMTGHPRDVELAKRLQARLQEITAANIHPYDPFGIIICPSCGSDDFKRGSHVDGRDKQWYLIKCNECGWDDATQ